MSNHARQPWVVGNWKMHGSSDSVIALIAALKASIDKNTRVNVGVCAPAVYLWQCREQLVYSSICYGGQDVSEFDKGAYTGETAASMLQDLGCQLVLVGHSERRSLFGDTLERINGKLLRALEAGLTPILCVGESLAEREAGQTEQVIAEQLASVFAALNDEQLAKLVVAYEPVWAIGTGKTASPEQAQEVHAFIRQYFAKRSAEMAEQLIVLYGGSVKADNASLIFAQPDVDGGLVGGAALDASQFSAIVKAAE